VVKKAAYTPVSGPSVMKRPHRRRFLHLAASTAVLPSLYRLAVAQGYPSRPVRIVAGFPPGGFIDTAARFIGPWLSERLGQQFVIENRPGAGGNIATETVVRAPPDGYTLLAASDVDAYNATLYDKLNFNFIRDIAPVASIGRAALVMVVTPSFPTRTLPEFIAYAKANPGRINMASAGPGSTSQLFGQLFKVMTGIDLVTVNYRGVGPALPDVMSGRVEVVFAPVATAVAQIRSSKLRALGVTTAGRIDALPDVPTIGEFVPGYEASGWVGIGAPAKTPPEIIAILNEQVRDALGTPSFDKQLADFGLAPFPNSPAEFGKFIAEYTEKWGKVIRDANIKPE
jgi:tripartite-type tricarboxylate transporter receptor subunit TctC